MNRLFCLAAGLALVAAAHAAPERPRLIVFMAVDGLPMRQIEAWQTQFAPDGFRRFLDRGSSYANARYAHGHTVTAVGHATMLSGAHPQVHGVISNQWTDPASGASIYCTEDEAHRYLLLGERTPREAGTSPKNLLAETVGDVLRGREPRAKVIAVSGKDRGAILPAGHKGTAYMYLTENGQFTSSSYYMQQHPAWVNAFNARRPADAFWGQVWKPLLPDAAYAQDAPDGSAWMASAGYGNRLPATLGDKLESKGPRYYTDVLASPFGDQLTLDFARAALQNEGLGRDSVPDILAVSLSSHDYISHAFGPESRLAHDHLLQLDRLLQAFFRDLDARIGKDRYAIVLTADHGFTDSPEWSQQQGRPGKRLPPAQLLGQLNAGLAEAFAKPRLARSLSASGILFDEAGIKSAGLDAGKVYQRAAELLRGIEGVAAAYGPADLQAAQAPRADQPHLEALRLAWHRERSAPLLYALQDGWLLGSRTLGATHGSPHRADQHVPILAWGPRWFPAKRVETAVQVVDIAPTVAELLHLPPPAQSQGRPLPRR